MLYIARSNCVDGDVRLVNGSAPYEGRVEICYDGVWGSVCDSGWDNRDASIVCLQMGFQGASKLHDTVKRTSFMVHSLLHFFILWQPT